MLRFAPLLVAVLVTAPLALGQHLDSGSFDPQTGEPIPLGGTPPDPQAASNLGGGEPLAVLAHLAAGSTKLVRVTDTDLVVFQNGADLVAGTIEDDGGAAVFVEAGRYRLEGQPTDMVVVGSLAYVTLQKNEGLLVLDLSDPADITAAGQLEGANLFAVAVQGDYAYVGKGTAGLAVYDVSDLGDITEVAALDTPGSANGLAVSGTTLYVADGNNSSGPDFRTYDVSDPTNPQLLGTYEAGGFVTYVLVNGGVAYLTGAFGLHTVDVSDPASPTFLGSFDAGGDTTYEVVLHVDAGLAFLAGLAGAFKVYVLDPANPLLLQSYTQGGQGLGIAQLDTDAFWLALFADRFEGLRLLDASLLGGDQLPQIGFVENGGFSHKGYFDGGYLYVTELAGTLRIIDLGNAVPGGSGPVREVGRIDVPPNTQEVLVRDGLAYVTDSDFGGTGLTVVDVSDPANPSILGGYGSADQAFGLDLVGTTLYLANGFTGLQTLDVSDPANPAPLGSFPMASNTVDVVVDPKIDVAYVVNFGGGMYSLDVSDPANPVQLDAEAGWGFLNAIDLLDHPVFGSDPIAGVADGQSGLPGLRLVDVTDPADLNTFDLIPTQTQARDVALSYGGCVDVECPSAWVADDFYGVQYFSALTEPFAFFESADRGIGVAVRPATVSDWEDLTALMAGEAGVYFFVNPIPVASEPGVVQDRLTLAPITPNPARGGATVRYTLPEAGPVTLAVYDLLGRRVAVLAEGAQAAGAHEARLDAARLPSGVYVVRLAAGGRVLTTKATVVR